jgi:hypothetical protein
LKAFYALDSDPSPAFPGGEEQPGRPLGPGVGPVLFHAEHTGPFPQKEAAFPHPNPHFQIRIQYFLISQLFAGFLLAHVVTYNHYSTEKFSRKAFTRHFHVFYANFHYLITDNDPILGNYACLQLYTTRNMRPGLFIDWLWGGLNYQIEHHLFPTMPRHNLGRVMPMVKAFCAENELPYMVSGIGGGEWAELVQQVDDYFTGFWLTIEQLRKVADIAADVFQGKSSGEKRQQPEGTMEKHRTE